MPYGTSLETLESRRLFAFAAGDATFGTGGLLTLRDASKYNSFDASRPTLVPLADGRLVLQGDVSPSNAKQHQAIRYMHGDGGLDTKRGINGTLEVAGTRAIAIDPATGRVALLHGSTTDGGLNLLELYSPAGKLVKAANIRNEGTGSADDFTFSFAPDGGVVLTSKRLTSNSPSVGTTASIVVHRYDANLSPVSTFGDNGKLSFDLVNDYTEATFNFSAGEPFVDSSGNVSIPVISRTQTDTRSKDPAFQERIFRFTSTGVPDASFGTNGVATVYSDHRDHGTSTITITTLDRKVAADGALYVLTTTLRTSDTAGPTSTLDLLRVDTDGSLMSIQVGRSQTGDVSLSGRVGVGQGAGGDKEVFVTTRGNGSATALYLFRQNDAENAGQLVAYQAFPDHQSVCRPRSISPMAILPSTRSATSCSLANSVTAHRLPRRRFFGSRSLPPRSPIFAMASSSDSATAR